MTTAVRNSFSSHQIADLLNGLRQPAVVLNPEFVILAANRAYLHEFGRPGLQVVGSHCYEVSHRYDEPCDLLGERCPIRCAGEAGTRCSVLHEHHGREGPVREEVVAVPLQDDDGNVTAFLETVRPLRVSGGRTHEEKMVGRSPAFRHMLDLIERVAATDIPVILLGESGTGKELAACTLHRRSLRAERPFVPVDCSGLAETLFESELLGHEKGAFTGAVHAKKGLVEAASGGTLFLDEVGDVPLSQQVKLLRILETGMFRRVGSVEQRETDFRLICATHRNLSAMVEEGTFRRDLFYRMSGFPVRLPPLRERAEDLEILCDRLLQRIDPRRPPSVSPEVLEVLRAYPFPGNVRELLNILQRAALMAEDHIIRPEHLPEECLLNPGGALGPLALWPECEVDAGQGEILPLERVEQCYLNWVAERFPGERAELARRLGLSERTLYRKLAAIREASSEN